MDYPVIIVPLSPDEGGGFLGYAPDLPGCMSDGETPAEAITNTQDAIEEWIDAAVKRSMPVPVPHSAADRERAEKARLLSVLKDVMSNVGQIESRLSSLEEAIREVQEKIDNADSWSRFASLTGLPVTREETQRSLPC